MKIFIISGPTASGKSDLALKIGNFQDISIINADSLQLYEGLPILSSQPSSDYKKNIQHLLYSYFKPEESCSVGLWLKLVKSAVEQVWQENKIPLIVGGTGMYISKLIDGINEIPTIDEALKIKARKLYENLERDEFIKNLIALGEDEEKISKLDKQRLIRVYEVLDQTKKSIFYWQNQPNKFLFDQKIFTHINLEPNREILYNNCNLRFKKMLESGAVEEVMVLINQGIKDDYQITKTLGFLEISELLSGKISKEFALEIASQKTRNYAKRQLTWFRNQFKDKIVFNNVVDALEFCKSKINEI